MESYNQQINEAASLGETFIGSALDADLEKYLFEKLMRPGLGEPVRQTSNSPMIQMLSGSTSSQVEESKNDEDEQGIMTNNLALRQ
jgi:hypothetical protein